MDFIKKIATEGKNQGAERPYIVQTHTGYTVVEGNTRIAAYKVLTGLIAAPKEYAVPKITQSLKKVLLSVDCSIAPNRNALLPIMARAHFGVGDKSKWGYLGSRKAVYDEWKSGRTLPQLARDFDQSEREIRELILEYLLYLKALSLGWTKAEKEILLDPAVKFNPPVRFLQTTGHKENVGISYDTVNFEIVFSGTAAEKKFKHLLARLVIKPKRGLGATASYDDVFADFVDDGDTSGTSSKSTAEQTGPGTTAKSAQNSTGNTTKSDNAGSKSSPKVGSLFSYKLSITNALMKQLMTEARALNCKNFPAAGTFLLRNIVEALLKHIIDDHNANTDKKSLDLEGCINLCLNKNVNIHTDDKKILIQFKNNHLSYLNLGAHGNVIPNYQALGAARDCIDQFVKRNI